MTKLQKRYFSVSRTVSLIGLAVLFCVFCAGCGGAILVNIPSLLLISGVTFFLLMGTFGRDYLKFIPDSLLTLVSNPSEPNERYADVCRFGSRYVLSSAVICTLLGFIQMLGGVSDPTSLGKGVALLLLPMFYALILSEIIHAL